MIQQYYSSRITPTFFEPHSWDLTLTGESELVLDFSTHGMAGLSSFDSDSAMEVLMHILVGAHRSPDYNTVHAAVQCKWLHAWATYRRPCNSSIHHY